MVLHGAAEGQKLKAKRSGKKKKRAEEEPLGHRSFRPPPAMGSAVEARPWLMLALLAALPTPTPASCFGNCRGDINVTCSCSNWEKVRNTVSSSPVSLLELMNCPLSPRYPAN